MTDDRLDRTGAEARLTATLRAVADREPVADAFDELRRSGDGMVVSRPPPVRPGAGRARALAVAAVAVTLVASAAALVTARRAGDDQTQIAGAGEATGWYLPEGLGSEWELIEITALPYAAREVVRIVGLTGATGSGGERHVTAEVFVGAAADAIWSEPLPPSDSDTARTDWVDRGDRSYRLK